MSATTDPIPAAEVPPGATFPVRVTVPAMELLLRDADDLDDLNRLLEQIRRLALRKPVGGAESNGVPHPESPAADEWGDPDDIHARIMLLEWISSQASALGAKPGQHILGTEWRILGVGDDPEELHRRVLAAEPELASARLVGYRVILDQW